MDRQKFSDIGHSDHLIDSPVSSQKLDDVIAIARCDSNSKVIDIGCGKGELLIRMSEKYGVSGLGIDLSPTRIEMARERAKTRVPQTDLVFSVKNVRAVEASRNYDVAVCMGAGSAFGGTLGMLEALSKFLRPGGIMIVDSGYWKQPPASEYLTFLGIEEDEYGDYSTPIYQGLELGLEFLYGRESNQDEWDHFEGLYLQALIRYIQSHPDDPDISEIRARIYAWRDAYYRWGRATLGYGLYIFTLRD